MVHEYDFARPKKEKLDYFAQASAGKGLPLILQRLKSDKPVSVGDSLVYHDTVIRIVREVSRKENTKYCKAIGASVARGAVQFFEVESD